MRTPNLKFILETILDDNPTPMSKQEKQTFLENIKNFSALGGDIYGKSNLEEITERVKNIVDQGERIMTESGNWFEDARKHKKSFTSEFD
jgi:hypothetical protein